MAKTSLFARLRRLARVHSARSDAYARGSTVALKRRSFLRIGAALPLLSSPTLLAACENPSRGRPREVAIIGAGLAGICCAVGLKEQGLSATVYEASMRIGGRTFTAYDMFPNGQVAELGGELIDSGHLTMKALAAELGIKLDDRHAVGAETEDVWWVNGAAVPEATIVTQFAAVAPKMAALEKMADEDDDAFAKLDQMPLSTWLDENLVDARELHVVLTNAYRGEFGLETSEQSALNLLYLIGSEDASAFHIFGDSDERYHAREGSQAFVDRLAKRLDEGQILLGTKLTAARRAEDGRYLLTFVDENDDETEVKADHVVFAIPFTKLREVDLEELPLSKQKREIIAKLGYGLNTKIMGAFARRVWLEDYASSGSVTGDEPFQQSWDTSLGQPGKSGILTDFLGGDLGVMSGDGTAEQWFTRLMVDGAEKVWPGSKDAYLEGSAVRAHWPSFEFNLGSYACYRPGQWAYYGKEGEREGNVHFCGEHCSREFQGYMEGAAETGFAVADVILQDEGLSATMQNAS